MPNRVPWTERTFDFGFKADLYPELIERLRGTPARADEVVRQLPGPVLVRRDGDTWSIQENLGHLADLEGLFTTRLDDFEAVVGELRPADMSNRVTQAADHNSRPIAAVLAGLRERRLALVSRLERLSPEDFSRSAMHPRLKRPMRVVDMMFFHAEHDDYHFARMRVLALQFA